MNNTARSLRHCALLAFVPLTFAVGASSARAQEAATPAAQPAAPPPRAPLMSGLDAVGLGKPMDDLNLAMYGYVEAGYFYDFTSRSKGSGPTYIGYNGFKNNLVLNKVDLNLERVVDPSKKQWDFGFHLEGIYGADAAFIHSNGMADTQTGRNQWDPLQAYVDVTLPGVPVRIRAGKWIELAGFEQFSANIYGAFSDPSRALYSYSYQFLYAEPGTQTGVLGTYVLNDHWSFDAGVTRGWNQSLKDSNGALDFLGRITYTPSDKTSVVFVMTEGPEFPPGFGPNLPPGDNHNWWTALDLVVTHKVTDQLRLGLGVDYVYAPEIPDVKKHAQWGGLAGYVSYAIDPRFTLNTRLEWYKDNANGYSNGAPFGANYYAATIGLAIKAAPAHPLLSRVLIRPEIRYDHSDQPVFNGGDHRQLTFSTDVLITF
jgi:hypothetical protein